MTVDALRSLASHYGEEGSTIECVSFSEAQRRDVESAIHFSYDRALAPIKVSTLVDTIEVHYHSRSLHTSRFACRVGGMSSF